MKERLYREEGKEQEGTGRKSKLEEAVLKLYRQIEARTKELRPYGGVWLGEAEKNREKLENFRYVIGIEGVQASGKSTLLNGLLAYPLLPCSPGISTNIPTRIRYGEKERIIITTSRGRSIEPGIRTMKKDFFEELLQYICEAYELFGLEHLTYFTDKPLWNQYGEGKGTLGPGDLDFHISSPKHKTVMLLILFLFYTDQKENEEILPDEIRQIIRKGKRLLKKTGLGEGEEPVSVLLEWKSPILKTGLEFIDIPGFGAWTSYENEESLHDKAAMQELKNADAVILTAEPSLRKADIKYMALVQTELNPPKARIWKKPFIPVINKSDVVGDQTAPSVDKLRQACKKQGIELERGLGTSGLYGEKRIFDENSDIPLTRSFFAQQHLDSVKELLEGAEIEKYIRRRMDRQLEKSGIRELLEYIQECMSQEKNALAAELLLCLYEQEKENAVRTGLLLEEQHKSLRGICTEQKMLQVMKGTIESWKVRIKKCFYYKNKEEQELYGILLKAETLFQKKADQSRELVRNGEMTWDNFENIAFVREKGITGVQAVKKEFQKLSVSLEEKEKLAGGLMDSLEVLLKRRIERAKEEEEKSRDRIEEREGELEALRPVGGCWEEIKEELKKMAEDPRREKLLSELKKKNKELEQLLPGRQEQLRILARQCEMGDEQAMLQMYFYFRDSEPEKFFRQAAAMWLIQAGIYGSSQAQKILERRPEYYEESYFPADPAQKKLLYTGRYTGKELKNLGLLNFKENTEYRLEAMENKGYVIAFSYAGCEERDEDGYGMEECYNFQVFDEFFYELWKVDGYSYREFENCRESFHRECQSKLDRQKEKRAIYRRKLRERGSCQ